jgi:uncharacterized protein YdeI (YjbR/CyaY-like superfamily)
VEQVFGKKRVKVMAKFEGEPYRGSVVCMGTQCHIIGVRKDIRQKIGKEIGDEIEVELEENNQPRMVEIPSGFARRPWKCPRSRNAFSNLSYTKQKEYLNWITQARRAQTRQNRILRVVEMLLQKKSGK